MPPAAQRRRREAPIPQVGLLRPAAPAWQAELPPRAAPRQQGEPPPREALQPLPAARKPREEQRLQAGPSRRVERCPPAARRRPEGPPIRALAMQERPRRLGPLIVPRRHLQPDRPVPG